MLLYFINIEYNAIEINNYYYNLLVCFNYIYDYLDILVHIELLYILNVVIRFIILKRIHYKYYILIILR